MIEANIVKKMLVGAGLKATHPRIVVFGALMKSEIHPTADQIFENIKVDHPGIARGSVYRILDHLTEAGLVNQVATKQGFKRYDANLDQHSHIYCLKTHDIVDFHSLELNNLIRDFFKNKKLENFSIRDIKLQINGEKIDPNKRVTIL